MIFLKFIAHRGLRKNGIKENTLASFQAAIEEEKASGFEFDIRITKDKEFVVNHNAFIKTDLIQNKTAKYLKKKYQLPTLEEVLSLETTKIILVEIKDIDIPYEKLIAIFHKYFKPNIYVMSFHNKVIAKLKELGIKNKLGILNYVLNTTEDYTYDFICLLNNLAFPKVIKEYQKRHIEVFIYGILNEEKDLNNATVYYIVDNI